MVGNIIVDAVIFFILAQAHRINVLGITASLGIGGIAIAFAAKQTLEQLLGGVVLYFFILGSSDNSLEFRKRLLELANDSISKKLETYGIEFTMQEPTLYLESPIPI